MLCEGYSITILICLHAFCIWRNEFNFIGNKNSYCKVHLKLSKLLSLPWGFAGVASLCPFCMLGTFFGFQFLKNIKRHIHHLQASYAERLTLYSFRGQTPLDMHFCTLDCKSYNLMVIQ